MPPISEAEKGRCGGGSAYFKVLKKLKFDSGSEKNSKTSGAFTFSKIRFFLYFGRGVPL